MRSEIADSIRPELEAEIPGLARTIANDLFIEWRNTKRNIRQVLDLAAANPQFSGILGSMASSEQVARLVSLVGMVQANGGDSALQAAIADGSLAAVANLPASAATLAAENKSLQSALDWYNAVGARLDDVVALELYKGRTPDSVDLAQLDKLVALGDKTAVARLSLLQGPQLDALLALPKENLTPLANQLAPDDLAWLGDQLPAMTQEQANDLVRRILSQPGVVPSLRQLGDLHQVVTSRSLDSAITFVAGPKGMADFWTDVLTVLAGSVTPGSVCGEAWTMALAGGHRPDGAASAGRAALLVWVRTVAGGAIEFISRPVIGCQASLCIGHVGVPIRTWACGLNSYV